MPDPRIVEAELAYKIVGAFYRVYNALGPGLLESLYSRALEIVFKEMGLQVDREYPVPIFFEGQQIGFHRIDMLIDKRIIIENKSTEALPSSARSQLRSYLGVTKLELGLLLHFGPKATYYRVLAPQRAG
jgi:GxxExxY protein